MALFYYLGEYKKAHELDQFEKLLFILKSYFDNINITAYLLGSVRVNGADLDALLITKKAFIGLEFKNYAREGCHVLAMENSWPVFDENNKPIIEGDGELVVKGGSDDKNPAGQAQINRSKVSRLLMEFKKDNNKENYAKRVPWFIIFHKELIIENKLNKSEKTWLEIKTNNTFLASLDSKLNNYETEIVTDDEIRRFLNDLGILNFKPASNWKKPSMIKEKTGLELLPVLSDFYKKQADRGVIVFHALLCLIMAIVMMFSWKWNIKSIWMNIGAALVVAILTWVLSLLRVKDVRPVPWKGFVEGGMDKIKGLNKFSFTDVLLCHSFWIAVAGGVYFFLPVLLDTLLSDNYAFFYLIKKMGSLIQSASIAIAVITAVSFVFRIYEMLSNTRDEYNYFSRYCLTMMPCTRSDIKGHKRSEYFVDVFAWFWGLITKSAFIVVVWISLTFFFDNALFNANFQYWPFKPSTTKLTDFFKKKGVVEEKDQLTIVLEEERDKLPIEINSDAYYNEIKIEGDKVIFNVYIDESNGKIVTEKWIDIISKKNNIKQMLYKLDDGSKDLMKSIIETQKDFVIRFEGSESGSVDVKLTNSELRNIFGNKSNIK